MRTIDKSFLKMVASMEDLSDQIETHNDEIVKLKKNIKANLHKMQSDIYKAVCVIEEDGDNKFISGLKIFYEDNGFLTQKQSELFLKSYDSNTLKEFYYYGE